MHRILVVANEVLVSTHPPGRSHWLERGLPERIGTAFELHEYPAVVSDYGAVPA